MIQAKWVMEGIPARVILHECSTSRMQVICLIVGLQAGSEA